MNRLMTTGVLVAALLLCAGARIAAQGMPVEGSVEATGKLVKVAAVGGETTGWAIEFEKEVSFGGSAVHSVEVEGDVKKFAKLEDKKVTVKGSIVHRSGTERKDRMVFAVQKIKEWKAQAAERTSPY
jgi:hypothetical protein